MRFVYLKSVNFSVCSTLIRPPSLNYKHLFRLTFDRFIFIRFQKTSYEFTSDPISQKFINHNLQSISSLIESWIKIMNQYLLLWLSEEDLSIRWGVKLLLLTFSHYYSVSDTRFLRDYIYANRITINPMYSSNLFSKAILSL